MIFLDYRKMDRIVEFTNWNRNNQLLFAKGRREMFYLTTHSTHFIYDYMASDIW